MNGNSKTTQGFLIMLLFILYFMLCSIRMILVGLGKAKDPIRNIAQKSKRALVMGIIGLVIFSLAFIAVTGLLIFMLFHL